MTEKSTKYFSNKQEKRVSKTVGGKVVIGSGATPFMKADVTSQEILYECKTNIKGQASISVKKEWFTKVKKQAYMMGKYIYCVVFSFGDGTDYYCLEDDHYQGMLEGYTKLNEIIEVLNEWEEMDKDNIDILSKIDKIVRGK